MIPPSSRRAVDGETTLLTTDLIRVRRRGKRLDVTPLEPKERERLVTVARDLLAIIEANRGKTKSQIDTLCEDVDYPATDYKLVKGLRKLLSDRCTFESQSEIDPSILRKSVFTKASSLRAELGEGEKFDSDAVCRLAAESLNIDAECIEPNLFADLKENHCLTDFDSIEAEKLVEVYEMSQRQAVLLRAVSVVVKIRPTDPGSLRLFFRRLKFRRLLYEIEEQPDGSYEIHIDGPFSLFKAVTKYGLQLALILPALDEVGTWELDAEIRWGKERKPYHLHMQGDASRSSKSQPIRLPDEVESLRKAFERIKSPWKVDVAQRLLDLPGVGICVPDLVFSHGDTGHETYLEVMGYWSRDAVWRRVELVEAGLPQPIIFALSSRLRVSESVLADELPGQLYVYKGTMNAKVIAARLDQMVAGLQA